MNVLNGHGDFRLYTASLREASPRRFVRFVKFVNVTEDDVVSQKCVVIEVRY